MMTVSGFRISCVILEVSSPMWVSLSNFCPESSRFFLAMLVVVGLYGILSYVVSKKEAGLDYVFCTQAGFLGMHLERLAKNGSEDMGYLDRQG